MNEKRIKILYFIAMVLLLIAFIDAAVNIYDLTIQVNRLEKEANHIRIKMQSMDDQFRELNGESEEKKK